MSFDLAPVLDHLGVDFNPDRLGNQKVYCPVHEDTVASASVSLDKGLIRCFGCDLAGDAVSLLMKAKGLDQRGALKLAQELAGPNRDSVHGGAGRGDSYLPRRPGSRPGRRAWKSPWARRHP